MMRRARRGFGSKLTIPNRELRHKLYAEGTVELDAPDVLAVPRTAVLWPGNNPRVYVEQGTGAYQQRRVILGRPGDDFWEVLEGLKEGERVVASGNMLIDGQAQLHNVAAPADESPPLHDPAMEMTAAEHEAMESYLHSGRRPCSTLWRATISARSTHAMAKLPPAPAGFPPNIKRRRPASIWRQRAVHSFR